MLCRLALTSDQVDAIIMSRERFDVTMSEIVAHQLRLCAAVSAVCHALPELRRAAWPSSTALAAWQRADATACCARDGGKAARCAAFGRWTSQWRWQDAHLRACLHCVT